MRALLWVITTAALLTAGSAGVHLVGRPASLWEPAPAALLGLVGLLGGAAGAAALFTRRRPRHGWPVVAAFLALLVLGATWIRPDMGPIRADLVGLALDGTWAATGEAFAWLALARAVGRRRDERPSVARVLRETAARWPDGAVLLAAAWVLTRLGGQLVVPGLVLALLFAQLATVIVYEPERNAFSAAARALGRAPAEVAVVLFLFGSLGIGMGYCLASAVFGAEEALQGLLLQAPVSMDAASNLGWYLGAAWSQWSLVRTWRDHSLPPVAPLALDAAAAAENPWAAGG